MRDEEGRREFRIHEYSKEVMDWLHVKDAERDEHKYHQITEFMLERHLQPHEVHCNVFLRPFQ